MPKMKDFGRQQNRRVGLPWTLPPRRPRPTTVRAGAPIQRHTCGTPINIYFSGLICGTPIISGLIYFVVLYIYGFLWRNRIDRINSGGLFILLVAMIYLCA